MTTPKTEIYFATRKTASAHVHITKGIGKAFIARDIAPNLIKSVINDSLAS